MKLIIKIYINSAAFFAVAGMVFLTSLTPAFAQPFALLQDEPGGPVYRAGELLVQFKPTAADGQVLDAVRRGGLGLIKHLQTASMQTRGHAGISRMATALPVRQVIQALKNHPAVEFAEPNWVYTHQAAANDPYFTGGQLWGMYGNLSTPANNYGSQAAEAWAGGFIGLDTIVVGVIDEGIQITHPDLAANIWVNSAESTGTTGVDDDGNGYVDDIHGWDFYENNNSVYDSTADDHATHVAGTIGAVGGNEAGVVGVNWAVTMISGKFLGPDGGTTTDAIEAVDYFTDLKQDRGVNIVALNNSWGGGGYSQALHDAIIRAAKQNILFIAAAGNGDWLGRAVNIDASAYYPASYNTTVGTSTETAATYDSVIAVTAIDSTGAKASWANYGATKVDLGAPGVSILSTLPDNGYGYGDGTSMATPHVTGAAALYASTHTKATASEIRNALLGATLPTTSLAGKTVTGGRLDLSAVIDPNYTPPPPPTLPTAPSGLAATAASRSQINLTWTDTSNNEQGFKIERSSNGSTLTQIATVGANVTSYASTGLRRNTTYWYRVRANNAVGNSAYSNTVSAKTKSS